jgi:hypothetical protein
MVKYVAFSKTQIKKLEKYGFEMVKTSSGPRWTWNDGFSDIWVSRTEYDEYEYSYGDPDYCIEGTYADFDELNDKLKEVFK